YGELQRALSHSAAGQRQHPFARRWHLDDERATGARLVPTGDVSALRPDGLSCDRQSEAESRAISGAAFPERREQVTAALRNSAARIFHLDGDELSGGECPQD